MSEANETPSVESGTENQPVAQGSPKPSELGKKEPVSDNVNAVLQNALTEAHKALAAIECIAGDDFCEDLEMRIYLPGSGEEIPADLKTAYEKLSLIYQISHSEQPCHSCHHVHKSWREIKERLLLDADGKLG